MKSETSPSVFRKKIHGRPNNIINNLKADHNIVKNNSSPDLQSECEENTVHTLAVKLNELEALRKQHATVTNELTYFGA